MRSIAFVANFHITPTYLAVARELCRRDPELRVTWFAVSARWARWLRRQGVPRGDIIHITGSPRHRGERSPSFEPELVEGEPTLAEAIAGDRVLSQRPLEGVLADITRAVTKFGTVIEQRDVTHVFGESTWAIEVALAYASRSRGVVYASPASVRYPLNRFGFFEGPLQRFPLPLARSSEDAGAIVSATLAQVRAPRSVGLWAENRFDVGDAWSSPGLWAEKVYLACTDSKRNLTQMTLREYARSKHPLLARKWTKQSHTVMRAALKKPRELAAPYILMPLQLQPEASVDVLAPRGRDQLENVRRALEVLPSNVLIAVKEHTHQFGSRNPAVFNDLDAMSRVVLVDAFADSRPWADSALAVITPSGTMAYEQALRGGLSFVMSPMFFAELRSVRTLMDDEEMKQLRAVDKLPSSEDEEIVDFLVRLTNASAPGLVSNPRTSPNVTDPSNIVALADGFCRLLDFFDESSAPR